MTRRRRTIDPMLSMINVVFLLIAFFLFGRLEQTPPVAVTLPHASAGENVDYDIRLYVDEFGETSQAVGRNLIAFDSTDIDETTVQTALITVDASTDANVLATALSKLSASNLLLTIEVLE